MYMLAVLLPILCFATLLKRDNFRESFLISAAVGGLFVVGSTEILSSFGAMAYPQLVACWSLYLLALVAWRYRSKTPSQASSLPKTTAFQRILLALLLGVVCITGITAVVAAPNNFDSLTYHLPRIMHWIQNGSVEHYPTHIDRQLVLAPFSEFAMMHLHILSGGDRFDNCVQWFSMVGSAIGVSLIVRSLQGSLNSQIVAAAISVSVPMGLLQSTSTQNDYAVTFWLVCLVHYVIEAGRHPDAKHSILVALCLALAIFTKGTAYLIALPFMLVYLWRLAAASGKTAAANLLVVAVAILLVNGGHYARNLKTYGNPISPGTGNDIVCTGFGATSAVSCLTKSVVTQLASGLPGADRTLHALTNYVHRTIGVDVHDPNLTTDSAFFLPSRNHEDMAPNPMHMTLMLLAAAALILCRRKYSFETRLFAITAMFSFVALSIGIKWNPFVGRYFLPVFVVSAPFLSMIFDVAKLRTAVNSCAVLMLLWSFSVLAGNEMRPLVGSKSVLATERIDQYFMARPQAKPYFMATAEMIKRQPSTNVGIVDRDGNMWEYVLWILLKNGGVDYRIEHVDVKNPSGKIQSDGFYRYFPVSI